MKRKIYITIAIIGAFVAVCTADGSGHEIGMRTFGVLAFGMFSYLGGLWGESSRFEYEDEEAEHEKYPEE